MVAIPFHASMVSEAELAYIAGFFDGEGSVSISNYLRRDRPGRPQYSLRIGISNTDREVLLQIKEVLGCGCIVTSAPRHDGRGHKAVHRWVAAARAAWGVLVALLPYLRVKKDQAVLAIAFHQGVGLNRGSGGLPDMEVARREELRLKMLTRNGRLLPGPGQARVSPSPPGLHPMLPTGESGPRGAAARVARGGGRDHMPPGGPPGRSRPPARGGGGPGTPAAAQGDPGAGARRRCFVSLR